MANLVWANTHISRYVMYRFILVCVYLLHNWQAYIGVQ